MNTPPLRCLLALCVLLCGLVSADAVAPKDGRYKGTITVLVVSEGSKVSIKQSFPVIGTVTGGALVLAMTEVPAGTSYFKGTAFTGTVGDGTLSLLPNADALSLNFFDPKTTATSFKGSVDIGYMPAITGGFVDFRRFISITMTRVGN